MSPARSELASSPPSRRRARIAAKKRVRSCVSVMNCETRKQVARSNASDPGSVSRKPAWNSHRAAKPSSLARCRQTSIMALDGSTAVNRQRGKRAASRASSCPVPAPTQHPRLLRQADEQRLQQQVQAVGDRGGPGPLPVVTGRLPVEQGDDLVGMHAASLAQRRGRPARTAAIRIRNRGAGCRNRSGLAREPASIAWQAALAVGSDPTWECPCASHANA